MAIETFENSSIVDTGGRAQIAALDAKKISFPNDGADFGNSGDQLRSLGDGGVEWAAPGMPTYEQTEQAISDWLDAHPEATTTVADGAITDAKLNDAVKRGLVYSFETVADMKEADTLEAGMYCHTDGFNSSGDGGAAWYEISATGTANEMDVIACGELFANLIIDGTYNPCQFGADMFGVSDSSDAINAFVQRNEGSTIRFIPGVYKLFSPIETDYESTTSIDFGGSKLVTDASCECALYVGHRNAVTTHSGGGGGVHDRYSNRCAYFRNFYIESHGDYAIKIESWYLNARFNDFTCYCYNNGIQEASEKGHPSDSLFDNFYLCNDDMNESYIGFDIYGTDSKYINGRIYAFKTGIKARASITLQNVHFLAANLQNVVDFNNDFIAILFDGNVWDAQLLNCYCDSYNTFIKMASQNFLICNIIGFKMNQYRQMTSGNGKVVDLTNASNFAHCVNITDAIVVNDNGKYNKFQFIDCPLNQKLNLYCNSRFENIVINNNDAEKFDFYDGVLSCGKRSMRTKHTLKNTNQWVKVAHLATSAAGTRTIVKTRNLYSNVTGVFNIDLNSSGIPTSIGRFEESGGHPRLGIVINEDNTADLYYTETQGNFYTIVEIEWDTDWYRLVPTNHLLYLNAPTLTTTTPTIVSPSA